MLHPETKLKSIKIIFLYQVYPPRSFLPLHSSQWVVFSDTQILCHSEGTFPPCQALFCNILFLEQAILLLMCYIFL